MTLHGRLNDCMNMLVKDVEIVSKYFPTQSFAYIIVSHHKAIILYEQGYCNEAKGLLFNTIHYANHYGGTDTYYITYIAAAKLAFYDNDFVHAENLLIEGEQYGGRTY